MSSPKAPIIPGARQVQRAGIATAYNPAHELVGYAALLGAATEQLDHAPVAHHRKDAEINDRDLAQQRSVAHKKPIDGLSYNLPE